MASVRGLLNIQSLNESTHEKPPVCPGGARAAYGRRTQTRNEKLIRECSAPRHTNTQKQNPARRDIFMHESSMLIAGYVTDKARCPTVGALVVECRHHGLGRAASCLFRWAT